MRKVKVQPASQDVMNMFLQLVDPTMCDPDITLPKYNLLKTKIKQIARFLNAMGSGFLVELFPEYEFSEINDMSKMIEEDINPHNYTIDTIKENWPIFKETKSIKTCINIYSLLLPYAQYIRDEDNLSGQWITTAGFGFSIFDFSKLDIYMIWADERCTDQVRKYILTLFNRIYVISAEIYDSYTTPDLDTQRFSELMVDSVKRLQELPELSRCNQAFNKITNSVNMLRDNLKTYHRDFISSKNPSIIMESYIMDLANAQENPSPVLISQFRKILVFYQKQQAGNQKAFKDNNLMKMCTELDEKLRFLSRKPADDVVPKSSTPATSSTSSPAATLPSTKVEVAVSDSHEDHEDHEVTVGDDHEVDDDHVCEEQESQRDQDGDN
jgi:hypothetical protein